jgi:hypothetical protein
MNRLYCTAQDAGNWGGVNNLTDPHHLLELVDPATDILGLGGHNMVTGDAFEITARAGTPATPLAEHTAYYAIVLSPSRWKAAATQADALVGIPIDITDEGVNMGALLHIPWDRYIEEESAKVGEMIPGNALPLADGAPVPYVIRSYASVRVARRAAMFVGKMSQPLKDAVDEAKADLKEYYAKGKPLRDQAPPATNTAVSGPRLSGSAADGRGWTRICGGVEVIP